MLYYAAIVAFVLAACLIALQGDEKGYKKSLFLWICTFALGYRTIEIFPKLKIHPSEVILWLLFILFILGKNSTKPERKKAIWPKFLVALVPFFLWGWITGIMGGRDWVSMFSEFKNFLILFPMIYVTARILEDEKTWDGALATFYGVGAFIAMVGIIEYIFPGVKSFWGQDIPTESLILNGDGFARAGFSCWGTPAATFVCLLALPMFPFIREKYDGHGKKLFIYLALVLQLVGIYIGGYRSIWLATAIMILMYLWVKFGLIKGSLILPIFFLIFYILVPRAGEERFESLFLAFEGDYDTYVDTSSLKRSHLAKGAMKTIVRHPFGLGWASAGWVHSDFLQVAVSLGLAPAVIFFFWYIKTLRSLWRRFRPRSDKSDYNPLAISLFLSFLAAGAILATQGVQVLPQMVLPVWFVWSLAEVWLKKTEDKVVKI